MEKAIKKAIEGGYRCIEKNCNRFKFADGSPDLLENRIEHIKANIYQTFLDPLFWQALGKSEGWGEDHLCWECGAEEGGGYKAHWHSFIDHLAEGKGIHSFFEKLISKE